MFTTNTSGGPENSWSMSTWTRAIMEAMVEPKRPSIPGVSDPSEISCDVRPVVSIDTCPYIHHRWCIQALVHTTGARSPHTPRTDQKTGRVFRHGLGLTRELSWSQNGLVFQELMAALNFFAVCRPVVLIATYPYIHHRWCIQALYSPPTLVYRALLGRTRKQSAYVDMDLGYHGCYREAETRQYSKRFGPR